MILENKEKISELSPYDGWVLHPLYLDNRYHPAENRISCIYLTNIIQWDSFIIPIEHSEKHGNIQLNDILNYFSENDTHIYVYDKKSFLNYINDDENIFDIQLLYYLNNDEWVYNEQFNDYYNRWGKFDKINTLIPLSILYDRIDEYYLSNKEHFTRIWDYRGIKSEKSYKNYEHVIHTLHEIEKNGIYKNGKLEYTQYNIYTSTGRPSNRFGGTNYAALNKSDDTRKQYTSRFDNGELYLYDYQAFHPTIVSNYLKIERPEAISVHEWLGRKYFNEDELSAKQYEESKKKTFFYLYGCDELHEDVENIEFYKKVFELKKSFDEETVIEDNIFGITKENTDIITTPIFKRKMDVKDMDVSKKFNYFLQSMESEINFVKMKQLNKFLRDKKSCLTLYTYDSFLIDIHPDEKNIVDSIKKILEKGNFLTTVHRGDNYKEMSAV